MKRKLLFSLLLATVLFTYQSVAQINTPMPSPKAKTESTVGLTDISISYFRPSVKGRAIFGEGNDYLQPYGQLWRAGANSGSVLSLSTNVKIAGKEVKAGDYLIFMTPGKDMWEFKLYTDLSLGGNVAGYDDSKEALSVSVEPKKMAEPVESLTYMISDISEDNTMANIHFMWENTSVKVPVEVSFDDIVMADIEAKTKVNPRNLLAAANYYLTADKDLEQALKWINAYLAEGNNSQQFWNVHTKAQILAKMGKTKEAKEVAKKSMELAKASPNGDFGYVKRNEDLIKSL
jgi:tetratricopeptide (TPR) repeat protein